MNNLEALNVMATRNSKGLKMSLDVTNVQNGKLHSTIGMMMETEIGYQIANQLAIGGPRKLVPMLLVVEMDEYRALLKQDYDVVMAELKASKS